MMNCRVDDRDIHFLTLSQRPCVVQHLDHYNKFIIGTYELLGSPEVARSKVPQYLDLEDEAIKTRLEAINNRAGKLILVDGAEDAKTIRIEYEFDCEIGGGVFDIEVRYEQCSADYTLHVAHSNGIVGLYTLSLDRGNKISLKEHTQIINSSMLTSIDIFSESRFHNSDNNSPLIERTQFFSKTILNANTSSSKPASRPLLPPSPAHQDMSLVVGDSTGFITVLNKGKQIRENVDSGDSIWQVKSVKLSSDKFIIIVGSENSSWYIYGFEESQYEDRLNLLYKNSYKDFSAGVTSITLLQTLRLEECDMLEILLGSYDESLQMYHVKLDRGATSRPDVCHKHTITIDQGGIWRVKPKVSKQDTENHQSIELFVAAMYAGSFRVSITSLLAGNYRLGACYPEGDSKTTKLIDLDTLKLGEKPLHYDLDVTSSGKVICIADFNNCICLIKTIQ